MVHFVSFWLVALGVPLLVVIGNSIVRFLTGLPQSAPADIVMALIVFDFAVLVEPSSFEPYIHNTELRLSVTPIYALMMIIGMISWVISIFFVELRISDYRSQKRHPVCKRKTCDFNKIDAPQFPYAGYFLSLFIPSAYTAATIIPFAFG